jgi:hypothetical protein
MRDQDPFVPFNRRRLLATRALSIRTLEQLKLAGAVAVLAAAVGSQTASGQSISAGPVFNPVNGHQYYLLTNSNWTNARTFALSIGGDLATINDAAENDFVVATFAPLAARLWIGFNDAAAEGQFVWANSTPVGFTNWEPGEPNNGGGTGENYVHIYTNNGRWNDVRDIAVGPAIGPLFGVVEHPGSANNSCSTPTNVSAGGIFNGTLVGASYATAEGGATCGDSATNPDVWYVFVAPCSGRLTASTCGTHDAGGVNTGIDTVLSLHTGCGPGTEVACNDDAVVGTPCGDLDAAFIRDSFLSRDLNPGESILIRVSRFGVGAPAAGTFRLNIAFSVPNDECASPSPITVGSRLVCNTNATTSPYWVTQCGFTGIMFNDLWYTYAPEASGVFTVDTCGAGTTYDTVLAAYAACPTADGGNIACNDEACGHASRMRVLGTAGVPVLLRLAAFAGPGTANLTIYCAADFNVSGMASVQDIFDFLAAYFANDPRADFNASGAISVQDIFDFLAAYFAGC